MDERQRRGNERQKQPRRSDADVQRFIQNKLVVLNGKQGARYQRDADRVVFHNTEVRT